MFSIHKSNWHSALRITFEASEIKGFYQFETDEKMEPQDYFALALSEWTPIARTPVKQALQPLVDEASIYERLVKQINGYDRKAFTEAFACLEN